MSIVIPPDWPREAVVMPCACGGYVSASLADPGKGLLAHYRDAVHRESVWGLIAAENDASTFTDPYEAQQERPTAQPSPDDLSRRSPRASAAPAGKPT